MSTYKSGDKTFSSFNVNDYKQFDDDGRKIASEFFESLGAKVFCNDGKDVGNVDFNKTDLRVEFDNGEIFFVEPEIKRTKNWKYLKEGLHFALRKPEKIFKNNSIPAEQFIFVSINEELTEVAIVDGKYMFLGWKVWPEYCGYGKLQNSNNFVAPDHGCYPVKKYTSRNSPVPEDFITISYARIQHYKRLSENKFELIKDSDKKFLK